MVRDLYLQKDVRKSLLVVVQRLWYDQIPVQHTNQGDWPLCIVDNLCRLSGTLRDVVGCSDRKTFLSDSLPESNHACRCRFSGFGCSILPFSWDSRFTLRGRSGLAHERRSRSVNQVCFGQAGAVRNDFARFPRHLLKDLGKKHEGRECVSKHSFPRDWLCVDSVC